MLATGLKAWVIQRLSAVYLALCTFWIVFHFLLDAPQQYQDWIQWLAKPYVSVTVALFFLALAIHAWVGIRDVIMDYVSPFIVRSVLLGGVIILLSAMTLWSIYILFNIEH